MTGEISRKTFLSGALGAVAAGALFGPIPASAYPCAPPPRMAESRPGIPSNVRLRGGNIMCSATPLGQEWATFGPTSIAAMWKAWDWEGWIAPQINDLVSVGGNAVRLWGENQAVIGTAPVMTQDLYFKQWQQLLDYAASLNLYVYACGGKYPTATQAQCVSHYRAWANLLADYPNVIGVDLINEVWGWPVSYGGDYASTVALVQSLSEVVREQGLPVGVSFPMATGCSRWWNWDSASAVASTYPVAPLFEASDIIDIHVYTTTTAADLTATMAQPWAQGKPMIFGETADLGDANTSPAAAAWYENIGSLITSSSDMVGAFTWSVYNESASDEVGLFSSPGVPVTNLTVPFQTWPTTR